MTLNVSCPPKARSVQLKAVVLSERVLGFDHPNTIQQYVSVPGKHAGKMQECFHGGEVAILLFDVTYSGPPGCVRICRRRGQPGPEMFPQSSSTDPHNPRRGPSIHRNTGCKLHIDIQQHQNHFTLYTGYIHSFYILFVVWHCCI